jgi:LysM repeat protein
MRLFCEAQGCLNLQRVLIALASGSALSACSMGQTSGSLTTASLPPRPAERKVHSPLADYRPPSTVGAPRAAQLGSGPASAYRWNGNHERVQVGTAVASSKPAGLATPTVTGPETGVPVRMAWQASPQAPVPTAAPARAEVRPRPAGPIKRIANDIVVGPGDTLFSIASRHNVSMSGLMTTNHLDSPVLKVNQHLTLPVAGQ